MNDRTHETMRVMIVAGEASGFTHAARLVEALRSCAPEMTFEFFGATGESMRVAGVETIVEMDDMARVGIVEVGGALLGFWRIYKQLQRVALERRPDVVVLVDFPEFNLRLARALHRRGLKIIYYISPQLWAWRKNRVRYIREDVDLLLAILPFEVAWYEAHAVNHVEFVGHPLVGEVRPTRTREAFCRAHDIDPTRPIVALLPGSRHQEITRHLPVLIQAANLLSHTNAQFVVAVAPNRPASEIKFILEQTNLKVPASMRFVYGETYDALHAAAAAAITSGTATLEAAMLGVPHVVVYRGSALNWFTIGRLVDVEHIGLINLIANRRLAPELLQYDFTPERTAKELAALLELTHNAEVRAQLREAVARLGTANASERAAQIILDTHTNQWIVDSG